MIFFFFYTQILQQPSFRETVLFIHSLLFSVSHQNDSFAFSSFFHGCLIPLLFSRHSLQDWKAMNKDTSEWMNQMQSMNEMNGERNESESVFEWLSVREKTVERSKRKLQIMWSKDRSQERREVGQKGEAGSVSFFFRPRLLLLHFDWWWRRRDHHHHHHSRSKIWSISRFSSQEKKNVRRNQK